jgi:hypothetical protein
MKSKKINSFRVNIAEYEPYYQQLKDEKKDFVLKTTTYSRTIEIDNMRVTFVEDINEPPFTLQLISKVRSDAEEFMSEGTISNDDKMIYFFDFYHAPEKQEIFKVDIISAYWTYALNMGVLKEKTNIFYEKKFCDYIDKIRKMARLKSLGSCATKKTIQIYEEGELVDTEMFRHHLSPVYKEIQSGVDMFMRKLSSEYKVYMYWVDCIFCPQNVADEIKREAKKNGFEVTKERAMIEYIERNNQPIIVNLLDNKHYYLRESDKYVFKITGKEEGDGLIQL